MESRATVELNIRGMDCAECAQHIEERLQKIAGVHSAEILFTAEKGVITYDPARTAPAAIVGAIGELGYRADDPTATAPPRDARRRAVAFADTARFAFVAAIALLALAGLLVERLGILRGIVQQIPPPLVWFAILLGGLTIFRSALRGLRARQINADLLMTVAIVGASVLGEFISAALIVFFMSIAHFLEKFTTEKSRAAIRELVQLTPKIARVQRNGDEIEIPAEQLHAHDIVIVRPGERLPADGIISDGASAVDQSAITGESMPVEKRVGDSVFAGSVNQRGALKVQVTRVGRDSMLGKIIRLVEEAEAAKAPAQKFADRYSAIYLPIVIGTSLLTYLVTRNPVNAIAVLVVACPCAIALATPLAVVAGVGRAARQGILIKGGLYLETLAKVDALVMDKTGTLTFGQPRVTDLFVGDSGSETDLLRDAATAENFSEHPLASAILAEAAARGVAIESPDAFQVIAGQGIVAKLNGREIAFGNRRLMQARGVVVEDAVARRADELERAGKTVMFLSTDRRRATADGGGQPSAVSGLIAVADVVREEAPAALRRLRELGIREMTLLTGDNARVASALAQQLGVEHRAEMLPEDKIEFVRARQRAGHRVAMIGDGINDAPALAQADVGIAMGAAGTDVAMEAAPIALITDDWNQIPTAVQIARRTFRTIQQNIAFGLLFNLAGLTLAAAGILTPVMAAAAQSLPDVAVFVNSSRLLRE
jgi:Cd2+/Zn2+-exporting ATPase/Cu+-exporting ATPase